MQEYTGLTSAASALRIYPDNIHQAVLVNSISIIGSGKIGAAVGMGFEWWNRQFME